MYDLTNVGFTGVSVATTTTPMTAFRGAGRPEAAAAIERAVDLFAAELGLDPVEVRRRNLVAPFADTYTTAVGTRYDVGDYAGALDHALAAADYPALRAEQARRRAAGDERLLGIGLSVYVEITAGAGGFEHGSVELLADGGARVVTGSTPYGQGHVTAWSMVVADRTGIPLERIEVVHGDTDVVPSGGLTGGSRSAQVAGAAVANASTKLVEAARQHAAELLEANPADLVLDRTAGRFHVAGTPARSIGWAEVAAAAADPLVGINDWTASQPTFPFGAHVAVVEVDRATGQVRVLRHVACDDAGTILNPLLADGQVHGGLGAGHRAGALRRGALRRRRQPADHQLRRLCADQLGRAPVLRAGAVRDTDLRERAGRQGDRRVGHDRRHAGRAERGGRRAGPPRRPPHRPALHARTGLGGPAGPRRRLNRRGAVGVVVGSR